MLKGKEKAGLWRARSKYWGVRNPFQQLCWSIQAAAFHPQPEEKQRASVAFAQLQAAMGTLGITAEEQVGIWRVLAGIYHLGAAGACKGKRRSSPFLGPHLCCVGWRRGKNTLVMPGHIARGEVCRSSAHPRLWHGWWL